MTTEREGKILAALREGGPMTSSGIAFQAHLSLNDAFFLALARMKRDGLVIAEWRPLLARDVYQAAP
jgi:hypothetical protein